jgi:hypothetical protein
MGSELTLSHWLLSFILAFCQGYICSFTADFLSRLFCWGLLSLIYSACFLFSNILFCLESSIPSWPFHCFSRLYLFVSFTNILSFTPNKCTLVYLKIGSLNIYCLYCVILEVIPVMTTAYRVPFFFPFVGLLVGVGGWGSNHFLLYFFQYC